MLPVGITSSQSIHPSPARIDFRVRTAALPRLLRNIITRRVKNGKAAETEIGVLLRECRASSKTGSHQCFYVEPTVLRLANQRLNKKRIQTIPLLRCIAKFACVLFVCRDGRSFVLARCVDTGRHDAENQDATFGSSRCEALPP